MKPVGRRALPAMHSTLLADGAIKTAVLKIHGVRMKRWLPLLSPNVSVTKPLSLMLDASVSVESPGSESLDRSSKFFRHPDIALARLP